LRFPETACRSAIFFPHPTKQAETASAYRQAILDRVSSIPTPRAPSILCVSDSAEFGGHAQRFLGVLQTNMHGLSPVVVARACNDADAKSTR
jgi:hypothetical protein